jgi:hypothetical protein
VTDWYPPLARAIPALVLGLAWSSGVKRYLRLPHAGPTVVIMLVLTVLLASLLMGFIPGGAILGLVYRNVYWI